jgi:hypothetical protein
LDNPIKFLLLLGRAECPNFLKMPKYHLVGLGHFLGNYPTDTIKLGVAECSIGQLLKKLVFQNPNAISDWINLSKMPLDEYIKLRFLLLVKAQLFDEYRQHGWP